MIFFPQDLGVRGGGSSEVTVLTHMSEWVKTKAKINNNGCVRLASLGRPRSATVRWNSFDGAHQGQPTVPCLWSGSPGGDLSYMPSPREGECDRSISCCQGLTRVSTAGST